MPKGKGGGGSRRGGKAGYARGTSRNDMKPSGGVHAMKSSGRGDPSGRGSKGVGRSKPLG